MERKGGIQNYTQETNSKNDYTDLRKNQMKVL